jgi:signal transduction histidine kinase/ligand-binding sensor domain-containing protein
VHPDLEDPLKSLPRRDVNEMQKQLKCRLIPLVFLVFACSVVSLFAKDHSFKTWNTESGLPQNSIQAIAQTRDGYIWIATRDGLARFDGIRFKIFQNANTPELPGNRLWHLFVDYAGRLWIFGESGDRLGLYENGSFRSFTKGVEFDFEGVPEYWSEERSTVFTSGGTDFVYGDGAFMRRPASRGPRKIGVDPGGTIWIDDGAALYSIRGRTVETHPSDSANPLSLGQTVPVNPYVLYPDLVPNLGRNVSRGHVRLGSAYWFCHLIDGQRFLVRFNDGKLDVSPVKTAPDIVQIASDGSGKLWIADINTGLILLRPSALAEPNLEGLQVERIGTANGLASDAVTAIFVDRDNNLWFGGPKGLQLLKADPVIKVISKKDGLPSDNIYAVIEDMDGSIVFGAWNHWLVRYRNGTVETHDLTFVTALDFDRQGRLLVGNNTEVRIRDGSQFNIPELEGFERDASGVNEVGEISFVSEDRSGTLWIGGSQGLVTHANGIVKRFKTSDGLPSENAVAFLETRSGQIFIGTTSGLARFDGERFSALTQAGGLPGVFVRTLYEDGEGTIWIGTYDKGLYRFKNGEFKNVSSEHGLFSNGVFCILEDDEGWFWMNSNQGIYRVPKSELNDLADGRLSTVTSSSYGPEDGLLNVEGNGGKQPAGLRSSDGRLWFPTAGGLAVIDPKRVHRDERRPDVLLEEVKIDQKYALPQNGKLELLPDQRALEINYTGISFSAPDRLQFKYRLEVLEDAWTEAGTRRTAYFSHLPYGEYTFRVIAANRDGVWNNEGAALSIVINRPFYRTNWFYVLAVFLVAGIAGLIYYSRMSQLQKIASAREAYARELIEAQERERSRIAMELHDSLGQSLVVIRNRALLGISKGKDDGAMLEQLQEISDASATALQETREIAHTLHPYQIEALGLTTALHSLIDKYANSSEIEFKVDIDEQIIDVQHDMAIAIYRIAQEWLTNVAKHSSADKISVALHSEGTKLALGITDNGVGFDPQTVKKGLGLKGIEERARMIGGDLDIESNPGSGSSLKLIVELT